MTNANSMFLFAGTGLRAGNGPQSSSGVIPNSGGVGAISPSKNPVSGSVSTFPGIFEQAQQKDIQAHPGLQKALLALSRVIESSPGSGEFRDAFRANSLAAGQALPQAGNFLPEPLRVQLQQLLDRLSEAGFSFTEGLPEQARLKLQQLLDRPAEIESGLRKGLPEQAQQTLQQLLDRSTETEAGLPEQARLKLQQLLDRPTEAKAGLLAGLPEQARQKLQQLLDRPTETEAGLLAGLPEQAQYKLQQLLDRSAGDEAGLPEQAQQKLQQLQRLLETPGDIDASYLANQLAEVIQQLVREFRVTMSAEKTTNVANVSASVVGDIIKSSHPLKFDADSESRNGSLSARLHALKSIQPLSAETTNRGDLIGAKKIDADTIDITKNDSVRNLFARTGLDQRSQIATNLTVAQPATEKIVDQMSLKVLSSSLMQATAGQSVEARDISSILLPVSDTALKPSVDVQATNPSARLALQQPLQHSEWGRELSSRVVWMTKQQIQTANIRLNPPHLGPIEVRVVVQNDQANVSFISQHAAVRDVIENSVPRLREMLGENGLNLADVDVSDQPSAREQQRQADAENAFMSASRFASEQLADEVDLDAADDIMIKSGSFQSDGLIDYYV